MSGKRAAAALMQCDVDLAERIRSIEEKRSITAFVSHAEYEQLARELFGLWTVSMAAAAAGVTEEQTVAALLQWHTHAGSSLVCQGIARSASRAC
ncbi:hypothetical protein KDX10_32935 [Burkholderia cenocepacia]|uniref:hypothetical protein n=1 Tax=Burkholderia cenocepacia TaxID=95486 RepID=UPI001B9F78CA|nr:hypothetical protein [Burkholderia cenocepacia]MBR8114450.1 hypothetical protein [Burkholderia cenocepacia]